MSTHPQIQGLRYLAPLARSLTIGLTLLWLGCEDEPPPLTLSVDATSEATLTVPLEVTATASESGARFQWTLLDQPVGEPSDLEVREGDPRVPESSSALLTPRSLGAYQLQVKAVLGERSVTEVLELETRCSPPRWSISLGSTLDDGATPEVGVEIGVEAQLTAEPEEGCPEVPPPPYQLSWTWRDWPASSADQQRAGDIGAPELEMLGERRARFTPQARGAYRLHLTARDTLGRESEADFNITVDCGRQAPSAEAIVVAGTSSEADEEGRFAVTIGEAVKVELSGSDPDESCTASLDPSSLSLRWRWDARPAGSQARLDDRERGLAGFTPDVVGVYTLVGEVTDETGLTGVAQLSFEAGPCGTRAPQINALSAAPERIDLGGSTTLSVDWGDPDLSETCAGARRESVALSWRIESAPPESIAQIVTPHQPTATFSPDRAGVYTLSVELQDISGRRTRGAIDLEVTECARRPLIVEAESSADEVAQTSLVTLSARARLSDLEGACDASDEPDLEVTYLWRALTLPAGANGLEVRDRQTVSWRADTAGRYVFEVTAHDRLGRVSDPSQLEINVIECGASPPTLGEISLEGDLAIGQSVRFAVPVSDPDRACGGSERVSYGWRVVNRPAESQAELTSSERARPSPTLSLDRSGDYTVEVEVTDETGLSQTALSTFAVATCGEASPTVSLEASELTPNLGDWVTLSAQARDPDSLPPCERIEPLSYEWRIESLPAGYSAPLNLAGAQPSVYIEQTGSYRLSVVAIDGSGRRSPSAAVSFEATDCGTRAPSIEAISVNPNPLRLGEPARLSAQVTDPDAQCGRDLSATAQLSWRLVSAPAESVAMISGGQTPSFTPDRAGVYVVRAVAMTSDGLQSDPRELSVEVSGCGGARPLINGLSADLPQARVGELITFTGSSSDLDRVAPCALNDPHQYEWRLRARPAGSSATLSTLATPAEGDTQASLIADVEGSYQVELIALDSRGLSGQDALTVSAERCGRSLPSLDSVSLSEPTTFVGRAVTLTGDATPPDATCVEDVTIEWSWSVITRPVGSVATLASPRSSQPTFTPDRPGTYRFRAQAISLGGVSEPQELTLQVEECGEAAPVITLLSAPDTNLSPLILGEPVSLRVEGSDPDEACGLPQAFSVEWSLVSAPSGSATILRAESLSASISPDLAGVYEVGVRLVETDGGRASELITVSLAAGDCGGLTPEALVGVSAPTLVEPAPQIEINTYTCLETPFVQLDASESFDPNQAQCGVGGDLSYAWSVREVSAGVNVYIQGSEREAVNLSLDGLEVDEQSRAELEVEVTNERGHTSRAQAVVNTRRLPIPDATQVSPSLFCVGAREISLNGTGFIGVGDEYPEVEFGDLRLSAHALESCTLIPESDIRVCDTLKVNLPDGLRADLYQPKVYNPYPLGCSDEGILPSALLISAPRVDAADPDPICRGQFSGELTLSGAGFLEKANGERAGVSVNGIVIAAPQLAECLQVAADLSACAEVAFELPISERDESILEIEVSNPPTAGCDPAELIATFNLVQSEPPQIDDVQPRKICDQGGTLTLTGDHFEPNMTVELGPYRADRVVNTNGEQEADAIWDRQPLPRFNPGLYLVTARNASGCEETFAEEVRVTEGPVPFFVDPPVVYSGINLQATAYLGNLFGGSVSKVEIATDNGDPIELTFSADPDKPSVIRLFLPQGLPDGLYDLTLYDEVDCPGTTPALLRVTSDLSLSLTELSPPFAWNQSPTSVTVFAEPTAGFVPTPRSYLSPATVNECVLDGDCGGGALCQAGRCVDTCVVGADTCPIGSACVDGACLPQAAELRAASLNSVSELKGVVAEGFSPGEYDLVVVNPNGQVGLLERALKVNPLPPPKVSGVSPGSWEVNNAALAVQVSGENFRDATIQVTCLDGGQTQSLNAQVTGQTGELIQLSLNTSGISATAVCSLRATNSDSAYADFSPLTATNPSGNFLSFSLAPPLPAGRARRLSAVTYAQIPNGPPRLYVLGGDQGADNLGLDDILSASLDAFGILQSWSVLPTTLPSRLTHIEAYTIGRFIYIAGGFNSDLNLPSDEIIRAELLDPLYVPAVDQVDFEFDEEIDGLDTGVYYYRVSAIYPANDPNNPNGESLSSEPQPVFIPDIPVGVRLVLTWIGLPDASGYRIYRSPTPDLLFGEEELIAEVDAATLTWSDEGAAPISQAQPLNIGELGNWSVVGSLGQPRHQHATVIAPDPADQSLIHLYVLGGLVNGNTVSSGEVMSIDLTDPRGHSLSVNGANQPGTRPVTATLSVARRKLKALKGTAQEASRLPADQTYLYALGGVLNSGTLTKQVEVAEVLAGGDLAPWISTNEMQRVLDGYGAALANNTLVTICGHNGSASANGAKGEICGVGECTPPELVNRWSGIPSGSTNAQACINVGSTSARGFFYLIGGGDSNGDINTKVDVSLLGGTP